MKYFVGLRPARFYYNHFNTFAIQLKHWINPVLLSRSEVANFLKLLQELPLGLAREHEKLQLPPRLGVCLMLEQDTRLISSTGNRWFRPGLGYNVAANIDYLHVWKVFNCGMNHGLDERQMYCPCRLGRWCSAICLEIMEGVVSDCNTKHNHIIVLSSLDSKKKRANIQHADVRETNFHTELFFQLLIFMSTNAWTLILNQIIYC